jgi:AraC family transcriptional regulator of arabinose operon
LRKWTNPLKTFEILLRNLPKPLLNPPSPPVSAVYGEHFDQDSSYRTVRTEGGNDWLMILTLGGLGHVASTLDIRKAGPGCLICFPPGAPQDYATHPEGERWDFLWMHFNPRPHWLPWLGEMVRPRTMAHWSLEEPLLGSVTGAWQESILHVRRPHPTALLWAQWAFERVLLLLHDSQVSSKGSDILPPLLARAARWGERHIERPFRLADWAAAAGVSESRVAHLAKEYLGESLQRYAERMKLQHAANLLRLTQLRIQEIAASVGYDDPFYFSTRFRRHYGKSPRAYRHDASG